MSTTILIVDDSRVERVVLKGFLKADYDVLEADSGEKAISLLQSEYRAVSAIMLDIVMPGIDGFETLKRIKADSAWQQIPVIIVTSLDDEESREKAITCGADNFVTKPYSRAMLLHILHNAIRLRETSSIANALWRDNLTGLLRRESFFVEAERMIRRHEDGYYTLSCFNVENFKVINDQYGTDIGDEVLKHIAGSFVNDIADIQGLACRYMADKFAILYRANIKSPREIEEIHKKATSPKCINRAIHIRIGRYRVNDRTLSVSAMFDRASMAERSVKGRFDAYIAEYTETMRDNLLREQQIVNNMESALTNGEFEPWLQPQYNHATGVLIGAEALMRWRRDGRIIPPNTFIPVFERNGFIYEADQCIWRQVCAHLRRWLDEGRAPLPVSVNISRYDLVQKDFQYIFPALIREYNLPADLLRLEITESAFSGAGNAVVGAVGELIKQGFTVEIDDFGSGYSSLNTLKDVPASILKLDMRFFEATENSQRGGNIVESVVRMAKWLGMAVIAEGVEDREQADYLKSIGCYYIQGYFYAKPMPIPEYEKLLDASAKEPKLSMLQTLSTLDNNEFWNPKSMETLIFNSYVGGACIFEFSGGKSELLRVNEQYIRETGGFIPAGTQLRESSIVRFLDQADRDSLAAAIREAIDQRREIARDIRMEEAGHTEYIRITLRMIAQTSERYLFYAVILNMTEQREAERKQSESARQLEAIMGNVNGSVSAFLMDEAGNTALIFGNDHYYGIFGYTKEQADEIGLDVMSRIAPDDYEGVVAKLNQLKIDGKPVAIDYRAQKRDGCLIYIHANASLMRMDGYDEPVIVSVQTDVTEQRTLEEQLRAVVDNINGGVSAVRLRGGAPEFAIVNNKYFEIIGYTAEQFKAEVPNMFSLVHPDDRARVEGLFREAAENLKPYTVEYRVVRRNGAVRYILCNTSVIRLVGIEGPIQLAVSNDITMLREAQRKEKEVSDRLNAVLCHAGNGITAIALQGDAPEFLFSNDRYYEIVGYTRQAYAAATQSDMLAPVHPADRSALRAQVTACNRQQGTTTVEYRVIRMDGNVVWVRSVITITRLSGVSAPVQIAMFADITEEREAVEQLRFLNDSAHDILAQPDSDAAIQTALYNLLQYFDGDRAYVIELNRERQTCDNTYEVCASGVTSERARLKDVPLSVSACWLEALERNEYIVINDVGRLPDDRAQLRQLLLAQAIQSLIIAPLWRDGVLVGYSGIDNPKRAAHQTDRLRALADYIAVLLTRRDLTREIQRGGDAIRTLMNDMPGGFCRAEFAENGRASLIDMNEGFLRMLGMARNEALAAFGSDILRCVAPEDILRVSGEANAARLGDGRFSTRCRLRRADGALLWAEVFGRFARGEGGRQCANVYFTDVSEKMSMDSLRAEILDGLPAGAAMYACDGQKTRMLCANERFFENSGRTRDEFMAITAQDPLALAAQEDRPKLLEMIRGFLEAPANGAVGSCVYRLCAKDGTVKWMTLKARLSVQSDSRRVVSALQSDVTDQVEAQHKQAELLDNLPIGAAMFSFDGTTLSPIHINLQYTNLVNRSVNSSLEGFKPADFIHPNDRKVVFDEIADAIAHRRDGACDVRLLYGDNEYRTFHLDAKIAPEGDGKYLVYVAYLRIPEQELKFKSLLPYMFSTIMEASTDIAYAKDINFRYLCCSKTFAALLGLKSEKDVVGKTDYELFPKDIADRFRGEDSDLFATGRPQIDVTQPIPSPNGITHYMRTSKHLLRGVTGEMMGVYCIGRDVTEIREAYARLKLLTDSIPGGIATFRCTEKDYRMEYFNDGFCGLFGYARDEFSIPMSAIMDFIFEEDRAMVNARVAAIVRDGTPIRCAYRVHTRSGGYRWVSHNAILAERVNGAAIVNAVFLDITEQQEEKERLRLAEEEYRIATRHSGNTIGRYDIATQTLTISEDAASRLALPECIPDVPYGRARMGKISRETAKDYIAFYEKIKSGEKECSVTFQKLLSSGWRWITERGTTLFDDVGRPVSAIISYTDVTDQQEKEIVYGKWQNSMAKRAEDSFTLLRCNLSRGASFDSAEGRLLDSDFGKDMLSLDEWTNAYVKKRVYAEDREKYRAFLYSNTMLAEYYRGHRSDALEYREIADESDVRWLRLSVDLVEYPNSREIEAYLMFENIDEAKKNALKTIERAETDPLTGLLNRATFAAKVNQIIGACGPAARHALFMLDIDNFKQVNDVFGHGAGDQALIDTADMLGRASDHGDLVGRLGGDEFVVFLRDLPAVAVAEKKARQICDLALKTYSAQVRISASVGIALCPAEGEGFETLYKAADEALYRVKAAGKNGYAFSGGRLDRLDADGQALASPNTKDAKASGTRRMLIVDDNKLDHLFLSRLFKGEFKIEEAMDGPTALSKLRHYGSAISVVLLDLMMPGMDGFEVLQKMQQNASTSAIPVIVVSGDEQRETALRVIRAGASDLVPKPVDPDILRIRVQSAISKAENERLRAQNSILAMRTSEANSYKTVLERSGILVIAMDWIKNEFAYAAAVSQKLSGTYDRRSLWHILLSDMVADSQTVQKMQTLVHGIAGDKSRTEGGMTVRLKAANEQRRMYEFRAYKEVNEFGLADQMILTLRETDAPAMPLRDADSRWPMR